VHDAGEDLAIPIGWVPLKPGSNFHFKAPVAALSAMIFSDGVAAYMVPPTMSGEVCMVPCSPVSKLHACLSE